MGKVWYKYKFFWRRGDKDGDESPQDRGDGTGDLIFNTMTKIVFDKDISQWAFDSFETCTNLLKDHKRWPDEFNVGDEAPNRYAWFFKNRLLSIKIKGKRYYLLKSRYGYRSQDDMTRDPYVAWGSCYAHLLGKHNGVYDDKITWLFQSTKIPWYLYRADTWRWKRLLTKDNRKHFVKRLSYFRALAVVDYFEYKDEDDFYRNT